MADKQIEVNADFVPPCYRKALLDNGYTHPNGMPSILDWTDESHLAYMDSVGIAKSILSISSPGTHLTLDLAATKALTREINEYAANVKRQYPDRFGFFATFSLPDIAASVEEIRYVLDTLDADGFVLHSNTAGIYLGDPILRRVLAELDACRAVVFVHTTAACHHTANYHHHHQQPQKHTSPSSRYLSSSPLAPHYRPPPSPPLFEFFFDSARFLLDPRHNPPFPFHPLPNHPQRRRSPLPPRPDDSHPTSRPILHEHAREHSEEDIRRVLRERFWWELAGDPVSNMADALLKFTTRERVVFGSDFPWTPFGVMKGLVGRIERDLPGIVGEEWLGRVFWGNAEGGLRMQERAQL